MTDPRICKRRLNWEKEEVFSLIIVYKLVDKKLIICVLGNLHYQISRKNFEPEPRFEPRPPDF